GGHHQTGRRAGHEPRQHHLEACHRHPHRSCGAEPPAYDGTTRPSPPSGCSGKNTPASRDGRDRSRTTAFSHIRYPTVSPQIVALPSAQPQSAPLTSSSAATVVATSAARAATALAVPSDDSSAGHIASARIVGTTANHGAIRRATQP